jgi:hypothetical protein
MIVTVWQFVFGQERSNNFISVEFDQNRVLANSLTTPQQQALFCRQVKAESVRLIALRPEISWREHVFKFFPGSHRTIAGLVAADNDVLVDPAIDQGR